MNIFECIMTLVKTFDASHVSCSSTGVQMSVGQNFAVSNVPAGMTLSPVAPWPWFWGGDSWIDDWCWRSRFRTWTPDPAAPCWRRRARRSERRWACCRAATAGTDAAHVAAAASARSGRTRRGRRSWHDRTAAARPQRSWARWPRRRDRSKGTWCPQSNEHASKWASGRWIYSCRTSRRPAGSFQDRAAGRSRSGCVWSARSLVWAPEDAEMMPGYTNFLIRRMTSFQRSK